MPAYNYVFIFALSILLQLFCENISARPPGTIGYLQQLEDDDWILKTEALHYLAENNVKESIEKIFKIAQSENENSWIRSKALIAYCKIQNNSSIPKILISFSSSKDIKLRIGAAESLNYIESNEAEALALKLTKDESDSVRYQALATYSNIKKQEAWPLVDKMTTTLSEEFIPIASQSLLNVGSEEAIKRLKENSKTVIDKRAFIESISKIRTIKSIKVLLGMLEQTGMDEPNYSFIISALSKNKKEDLTNSLSDLIMTGRDQAIFVSARVITHLLQDPELGKKLRRSIKDSTTPETLEAVMVALGAKEMDPDSNLDFFVNYLKDDDPEIRELSIRCLSHCKEANLYDLLEETIKDEENRVSLAAMNALMDAPLDDAPTGELVSYLENALVNTDTVVRKTAFDLLGHAGSADDFEPALAMLGEALSGSDTIRREAVAEALGSIAPDNGVANVASRQGYVSKWMVLGTFLNDKEHKAFAEELEPEKSIDFEKTYPSKYVWALQGNQRRDGEKAIERDIGWSEASVNKTNGMLLMGPLLPPPGTFSIAYAVSDFTYSKDQELFLTLDGDDAFKVWLNGEKIAEAIAPYLHRQSCVATLENIKIKLKKGKNRILIKSANIENEWWVRARITDANNRPVELF
ncbi:MAG: HEAT repeat domain-containing protein [Verrucomicrobiota bacterium]|nr:HEAT repeat domain-containing protein [Verrucomicrobiota bacterium]